MIRAEPPGVPGLVLFGVVRGIAAEGPELRRGLDAVAPGRIVLGISPEEADGLREHFVGTATEPLVPLLGSETVEIRELSRYGEVRVPHPGFLAALAWAHDHGVPAEPIDPTDGHYAEMFGSHIGYLELVRRTLRERRLLRSPPKAADADGFVVRWDAVLNKGRGSQRLQADRDRVAVLGLRRSSATPGPLAGIFERERLPGLLRALDGPAPRP